MDIFNTHMYIFISVIYILIYQTLSYAILIKYLRPFWQATIYYIN